MLRTQWRRKFRCTPVIIVLAMTMLVLCYVLLLDKRQSDTVPNHYVTILFRPNGRIGNRLFQIAVVLATARAYGYTPVLPPEFITYIRDVIDVKPFKIRNVSTIQNNRYFQSDLAAVFDQRMKFLSPNFNWTLDGYFQSWKYFADHADFVRDNMQLNNEAVTKAIYFLGDALSQDKRKSLGDFITIGVHVRRGDFLWKLDGGFAVAGKDYIYRAIDVYRKKYTNNLLKFIFVSDDIRWCRKEFRGQEFAFSPFLYSPAADLALLSLCNHSIITGGTFGWMGAWFCNGDVIYYSGYPTPNTFLGRMFNKDDYYPPHWKGLY